MANERQQPNRDRLPIKLILPRQGSESRVSGGGGAKVPFRTVDTAFRQRLHTQVDSIRTALTSHMARAGNAPVKVRLLRKASAKSHRPDTLFSNKTCPIVGNGALGELIIKATQSGLNALADQINSNTSDKIVKELSCVESIEPVSPQERRKGRESLDILKGSPRGRDGFLTRVRLFDFGRSEDQAQLVRDFEAECNERKIAITSNGYANGTYVYGVECRNAAEVDSLANIIGVRSISQMPLIRTIRPQMVNTLPLPPTLPQAVPGSDFPVIAVVDSGVSASLPALESWVVDRKSDVAPEYRNTDHGTFVAGLIAWGGVLNPTIPGIDSEPCGVIDLQVLPNTDPSRGDTDVLTEQDFLQSLEEWLKQYANRCKVWNLSLGTNEVCSLDEFSALAEQLDKLQEQYSVSFVVSAGNYTNVPLLDFPRTRAQLEQGRITSPADSILAITVGSISQVGYQANGPHQHQPSSFSRHGAGPNHIIKPDLIHYGGSCTTDFSHVSGVRSINGSGTAEDIGTSYATPLVARTLAQVYHQITPTPSPVMARALITHHARDPRLGGRVPDGEENFFGFGLPAPVPYCLECNPHTSTLVFEDTLRPGYFLEWDDFPYPSSLRRDGRYFGEVWMTVAFAPARGARWGSEYCETHIDAHFGVYQGVKSRSTGKITSKFRGLVPPEHKNPGELYETYQVEKLRKWSPVRTYHGDMGEKGERGDRWRLKVQLLTRHGIEDEEAFKPQPFALIVTIADPLKTAPVYDEMAKTVRNRFKAENMTLRTAARLTARN
jgi:serine protease AprX